MAIKIWVVWTDTGNPIEGAEYDTNSPADAICVVEQYQEIFEEDGIVRVHAGSGISNHDLKTLLDLAASKGIILQSTFP